VVTTAVLPLLPETPRYPKLIANPKYGEFTYVVSVCMSEFFLNKIKVFQLLFFRKKSLASFRSVLFYPLLF
jgi:hypothetical protein